MYHFSVIRKKLVHSLYQRIVLSSNTTSYLIGAALRSESEEVTKRMIENLVRQDVIL